MKIYILLTFFILQLGCTTKKTINNPDLSGEIVSKALAGMTDVMLADVTNPPLAARFFAYATLAGYEVLAYHGRLVPMENRLNAYPRFRHPSELADIHITFTAYMAMLKTAARLQPSGQQLMKAAIKLKDSLQSIGIQSGILERSIAYADSIAAQMIQYAASDGYLRISNQQRYEPSKLQGKWYPTPPSYLPAVEPYFGTLRPLILDSGREVRPVPPLEFNLNTRSRFMKQVREVYQAGKSYEQKEIAAFWDCNPFAIQDLGHLVIAQKKISPGAHWIGITGIAARLLTYSFEQTLRTQTIIAIGLFDSFISCWAEKYNSDRIRPETVIRQTLDPNWYPLLQTPPFPEYTSGHSVISACSAELLSSLMPQPLPYSDTIEVHLGLPARSFQTFRQAAEEAAISRLHGGIHFRDAIENGEKQGKEIAALIRKRLLE